jgi:hypothetical protein
MGKLNLDPRKVTRALQTKLRLSVSSGKELQGWYCLDGKKVLRVTLPHDHGTLPPGTANAIRNELKLDHEQFARLVQCPMKASDYEALIRTKMDAGKI